MGSSSDVKLFLNQPSTLQQHPGQKNRQGTNNPCVLQSGADRWVLQRVSKTMTACLIIIRDTE